ncbi:MAG: hypothetical protein QNJ30_07145 [Kiloniellales bacterium]|nr:hypothetical protein [Kiloniellales bacterium]
MIQSEARGIAVLDVGSTNTRLMLFGSQGQVVAEARRASPHLPGPPYAALDPEPLLDLAAEALPAFDRRLPVDAVVPCAHGSALACLDAEGELALPVMDYEAEPPPEVLEAYARVAPAFAEVFAPTNPMALTLGLQLFWQEMVLAEAFARVASILPWGQYFALRLGGRAVSEVTALGAQTHLWDVRGRRFSSLARARGWDRRFAPPTRAWETVGLLDPRFRGDGFRGQGRVLAGIHDSNANYLRYLAAGLAPFTLLSSGTWIIGFDTETDIAGLDPQRDTATNSDVFGRPVACCRFMGGREWEVLAEGAPAVAATPAAVQDLVARGSTALPSFTDSGGPMPGSGGRGRLEGPPPQGPAERAALAALYCALMTAESLDAVGSRSRILVDGPFAENAAFLGLLAALRPGQGLFASRAGEGTAAGAALLALMTSDGGLPEIGIELSEVRPLDVAGLGDYRDAWRRLSQR